MPEPFRDKESGKYFVSFSSRGERHKRSIGSSSVQAARRAQRIADGRAGELRAGLAAAPEGVAVADLVFDRKQEADPDAAAEPIAVEALVDRHLEGAALPDKARSTYDLETVHADHPKEFAELRAVKALPDLDRNLSEAYKRWRHGAGLIVWAVLGLPARQGGATAYPTDSPAAPRAAKRPPLLSSSTR
jgi:hypothetical protein